MNRSMPRTKFHPIDRIRAESIFRTDHISRSFTRFYDQSVVVARLPTWGGSVILTVSSNPWPYVTRFITVTRVSRRRGTRLLDRATKVRHRLEQRAPLRRLWPWPGFRSTGREELVSFTPEENSFPFVSPWKWATLLRWRNWSWSGWIFEQVEKIGGQTCGTLIQCLAVT